MLFRSPVYAGFKHGAWNAIAFVLILSSASTGCTHRNKKLVAHAPPPPVYATVGAIETGIASWYGDPYHGRQAASGEIFDKEKLTAAHRTLPFQTWVEVTNLENGKRVTVRINDRGPFIAGRIIDLSQAAGREIDLVRMGIARVRVEVIQPAGGLVPAAPLNTFDNPLSTPPAIPKPGPGAIAPRAALFAVTWFTVQAASFAERERAELLSARMAQKFGDSRVAASPDLEGGFFWQVFVGRQLTQEQAKALAVRVSEVMLAAGGGPAASVPEPF